MSFFAKNFVFNGVGSDNYNLTISSIDSDSTTNGSSDVQMFTDKVYRRPVEYLYGVSQSTPLEFPVKFNTPTELTAEDLGLTQTWLFGQTNYRKLQILQADMMDIYFNCFLKQPKVNRTGNIIVGIEATVHCDSPFAWTYPKVFSYTYGSPPSSASINIINESQIGDYAYPIITFIMTSTPSGNLSITNLSDNARVFTFTGMGASEVITIDNDKQIITSSIPGNKLSKFNKNFFRLVPGHNTLQVTGGIVSLSISYPLAKKIGG